MLLSCSADVSVWIVGLPFGLDDGTSTRTCDPCFGFLGFFLSLLLVFMPSPFPCWIYCSTSLGEIFSTGTKNNGEPFVVGRGTEEAPFLPAPVVYIVAFAGIIDEAHVFAEVPLTLVDG